MLKPITKEKKNIILASKTIVIDTDDAMRVIETYFYLNNPTISEKWLIR